MILIHIRRALALSLSVLTLGSLLAAPITAHAEGKGGKGPVVIEPPIITNDPTPPPAPKPPKKDKK